MAFRILHLTDIHFGCENWQALAAVEAYVRAAEFDLLLATGDITQLGKREEFEAARDWFQGLPGPQLMTPGNHDTPWYGLIQRVFSPFGRYEKALGPAAGDGFDKPGLRVRAMNSARGWQVRLNWSKGNVSRRQARRTAAQLAAAPSGDYRILVCHHPLSAITRCWKSRASRSLRARGAATGRPAPWRRRASMWWSPGTYTPRSSFRCPTATGRPMRWAAGRCRCASAACGRHSM